MSEPLPEDLQAALENEVKALEASKEAQGVSADLIRFTEAVARAQIEARAAIRAARREQNGSASSRGEEALSSRVARPLALDEIDLATDVLEMLLKSLEKAAEDSSGETGVRALSEAAAEDRELPRKLARASLPGGDARVLSEIAKGLQLPAEALLLIGRLLAAPFVYEERLRAGELEEIDARDHDGKEAGRCPTCGSLPGLAVLDREDGARRLLCALCGDSWLAPRLMCTACGNREQGKLGTLCLEESDPRWLEVCDVCRRYLKTVDEGRLPEGYPVLLRPEDARTMYLDMIAEEEGYVRSAL